ncbi:hypothetical protein, partial [Bacteroides uniformis]|uniref:hypothetical protein n=1 Tax=Bacteroides uniformis TaxID=820 RepID=UPI001AA16260
MPLVAKEKENICDPPPARPRYQQTKSSQKLQKYDPKFIKYPPTKKEDETSSTKTLFPLTIVTREK